MVPRNSQLAFSILNITMILNYTLLYIPNTLSAEINPTTLLALKRFGTELRIKLLSRYSQQLNLTKDMDKKLEKIITVTMAAKTADHENLNLMKEIQTSNKEFEGIVKQFEIETYTLVKILAKQIDKLEISIEELTSKGKCEKTEWLCGNGNCVPLVDVCDDNDDCEDNSDEADCKPVEGRCGAAQFTCRNGNCTKPSYRCDEDNDCGDNSDEEDCMSGGKSRVCLETSLQCNDGTCVSRVDRCDGIQDCPDNTDELNCIHGICPRAIPHWKCDNGKCVDPVYRCDGNNDCIDNSDEIGCDDKCDDAFWRCKNRNCINPMDRCDENDDCKDGSDEENCPGDDPPRFRDIAILFKVIEDDCEVDLNTHICEDDARICSPNQWRCKNQKCIRAIYRCDDEDDCGDGSDEVDCTGIVRTNNISRSDDDDDDSFQRIRVAFKVIENDCGNNTLDARCEGRAVQCDHICKTGNPGKHNEIIGRCCLHASRTATGHCRPKDIAYCGKH